MTFTFVNATTTGNTFNSGSSSITATLPTGIANGDFIVLICNAWISGGSITLPAAFTVSLSGHGNQSTSHPFAIGYRVASSEPSSYTITLSSTSAWGSWMYYVIRGGATVSPVANFYSLNNAASYSTSLPSATGTINTASDATIYGYMGVNSAASGTESLTLAAALSNITTQINTSAGETMGIGWGVNVTSPASATDSGVGVDYTDFMFDISPASSGGLVTEGFNLNQSVKRASFY